MNQLHIDAAERSPLTPDEGPEMGGSERSATMLAEGLAARGWSVTICGTGWVGRRGGVLHVSPYECPEAEVVVAVERRGLSVTSARARRVAWSHSASWPRSSEGWDAVVAGGSYHGRLLEHHLRVGVEVLHTPVPTPEDTGARRDRFLYASSPDRGLHRLLQIWPRIWREFGVPLSIAYDVRSVLRRYAGDAGPLGQRLRHIRPMLDQPGVVVHPVLSETELLRLRERSIALVYPLDPVAPHAELLGLSVLDACAAGCPPILSLVDCFPSEYRGVAEFVDGYEEDGWIAAIHTTRQEFAERSARARQFARARNTETWLDGWERVLNGTHSSRPDAPQRWTVIAGGSSIEEAAQARSLIMAAQSQHVVARALVRSPVHARMLAEVCRVELVEDIHALATQAMNDTDRIVLVCSATCRDVATQLVFRGNKIPVASLDEAYPSSLDGTEGVDASLVCSSEEALLARLGQSLPPGVPRTVRRVGPLDGSDARGASLAVALIRDLASHRVAVWRPPELRA